jgi:hypothetical protein
MSEAKFEPGEGSLSANAVCAEATPHPVSRFARNHLSHKGRGYESADNAIRTNIHPAWRITHPTKKPALPPAFSRLNPPKLYAWAASSAAASCFAIAPLTADCTFSKARTSI